MYTVVQTTVKLFILFYFIDEKMLHRMVYRTCVLHEPITVDMERSTSKKRRLLPETLLYCTWIILFMPTLFTRFRCAGSGSSTPQPTWPPSSSSLSRSCRPTSLLLRWETFALVNIGSTQDLCYILKSSYFFLGGGQQFFVVDSKEFQLTVV